MSKQKILLLGRKENRPGFESPDLFKKFLPDRMPDFELSFGHFEELQFFCAPKDVKIILNGVDIKLYHKVFIFGWYKDWKDIALATAYYLNFYKVKIVNTEALYQRSSGKVSQAVIFGLNNLSIPKTYFSSNILKNSVEAIMWMGGMPVILKQYNGNKGKHNYLVKDEEMLKSVLIKDKDTLFLIQEFIANDGDMRVIVSDKKVSLILRRRARDNKTHLHNISQGAEGSYLDLDYLPSIIKKDCIKASILLNRELSGLDVVEELPSGKFYILESNNLPQLASWEYYDKHLDVLVKTLIS